MNKMFVSLVALTFAGAAGSAVAQDAAAFADVDTDQSGDLTLEEVQVVMPDLTQEDFDAADADASGTLSEEEYTTLSAGGAMSGGDDAMSEDSE